MIILGVDPGGTTCGYALVWGEGRKVRFVSSGTFDSDLRNFQALVLKIGQIDRVAIEQPAGFVYQPFRGPHLIATATIAGGIAWAAEAWGHAVFQIPATSVREALVGKTRLGGKARHGDMDKIIAMTLPGVVIDMPKKSNAHVRDALALCVVTNWMTQMKGQVA